MKNKSFVALRKLPHPILRLVCFHHAGGSASAYNIWKDHIDPSVEIYSLQLPGRETRIDESLGVTMDEIQQDLLDDFFQLSNLPFIFFGHSLGGFVAYELAKRIYLTKSLLPCHLIIAAIRAPHVCLRTTIAHHLNDEQFLDELNKYEAIPQELVQQEEFRSFFLPIIKSDFAVSENYIYTTPFALDCNITSITGNEDHSCSSTDSAAWKQYTTQQFCHHVLEGNHFFIKSNFYHLKTIVNNIIRSGLLKIDY